VITILMEPFVAYPKCFNNRAMMKRMLRSELPLSFLSICADKQGPALPSADQAIACLSPSLRGLLLPPSLNQGKACFNLPTCLTSLSARAHTHTSKLFNNSAHLRSLTSNCLPQKIYTTSQQCGLRPQPLGHGTERERKRTC